MSASLDDWEGILECRIALYKVIHNAQSRQTKVKNDYTVSQNYAVFWDCP